MMSYYDDDDFMTKVHKRNEKKKELIEENKEVLDMVDFIEQQNIINREKKYRNEINTYDYFNSIDNVKTEYLDEIYHKGMYINLDCTNVNAVITYAFPIKEEYFEHLKKQYNDTESSISFHTNFKNEEEDKVNKTQKAIDEYVFKPTIKKNIKKISKTYKRDFISYYLELEGKRLSNLSKATDDRLDELIKKYVPNKTFEEYDIICHSISQDNLKKKQLSDLKFKLELSQFQVVNHTNKLAECKKVLPDLKYELYKCKLAKYTTKTEGKKKKLVWSKLF